MITPEAKYNALMAEALQGIPEADLLGVTVIAHSKQ